MQVDPDELVKELKESPNHTHRHAHQTSTVYSSTPYSSRYNAQQEIPKFRIPQEGVDAEAVHSMLRDELDLDGRPNLNLARYERANTDFDKSRLLIWFQFCWHIYGERCRAADDRKYLEGEYDILP